jgi:hypothetical protein
MHWKQAADIAADAHGLGFRLKVRLRFRRFYQNQRFSELSVSNSKNGKQILSMRSAFFLNIKPCCLRFQLLTSILRSRLLRRTGAL